MARDNQYGFYLNGFKGKRVIVWTSGKLLKELKVYKELLKQIDFIVIAEKKVKYKEFEGIKVINHEELLSINQYNKVVVINTLLGAWEAISSYLYINGIYDVVPFHFFQYLHPYAKEFEEIMTVETINATMKKDGEDAILIRGRFEPFFTPLLIKRLRMEYADKYIVLSTWEDTPEDLLFNIDVDKIILNEYPSNPGQAHRNYQIQCVASGLKWLKELGFKNILINRTDQILLRNDLFSRCKELQTLYPNTIGYFKKRVVLSDLYFRKHVYFHPSDMFMFGDIDDLLLLWDIPFDNRTKEEVENRSKLLEIIKGEQLQSDSLVSDAREEAHVEVYILKSMLKRFNYSFKYTQDEWNYFVSGLYIIRDYQWWKLFWFKPDKNPTGLNFGREAAYPLDLFDQTDWEDLYKRYNEVNIKSRVEKKENFNIDYVNWKNKKINAVIDYYGEEFFKEKKVLLLGQESVELGTVLSQLGSNIKYLSDECKLEEEYDLIVHMGVLHSIKDYKKYIADICSRAKVVVLELEVCDSSDCNFIITSENQVNGDNENYTEYRPSGAAIEKVLNNSEVKYNSVEEDRCNSGEFEYDWKVKNTNSYKCGMRRMWFIHKLPNISCENLDFINQVYQLSQTGTSMLIHTKNCILEKEYTDVFKSLEDINLLFETLNNALCKFSNITGCEDIKVYFGEVVNNYGKLAEMLHQNNMKMFQKTFKNELITKYGGYFKRMQQIMNLY